MFHLNSGAHERYWSFYRPLTLLAKYKAFQKHAIDVYTPYRHLVGLYSEITERKVYPVTKEYLEDKPEVVEQNVALLKNAIELHRIAGQTTEAVAPILFHYSWHCFNAFFAYTFFRWETEHSRSHGIQISKWNNNVEEFEIQFLKRGLIQRLIDTWTLLGTSLAFSAYLPVFQDDEIKFQPNKLYLLSNSNYLKLKELLNFDPVKDYERKYWNIYGRDELLQNPLLPNSMNLPTKILKSYLIIFIASSIARYRPVLWSYIIKGIDPKYADFALYSREALRAYTYSNLMNLSSLLQGIINDKFEFKKLP